MNEKQTKDKHKSWSVRDVTQCRVPAVTASKRMNLLLGKRYASQFDYV